MKQKLILTSIFAISIIVSAYAEPTNTVNGAPTDGVYEADTIYTGAATEEELGVYENDSTATAKANYEYLIYNISAGNYLAAGSEDENGTICPIGSYCGGLTNVKCSIDTNQGIVSCPIIDNKIYTTENTGSSSVTACYTEYEQACSTVNTQATIGSGHVTGITYANTNAVGRRYATSTTTAGEWTLNNVNACDIVSMTCDKYYHYEAGGNPLANMDVSIVPMNTKYKSINGFGSDSSDTTGLNKGNWESTFSYGVVRGQALCSTTSGTNAEIGAPEENGNGQYCWCKVDGFIATNESLKTLSSSYVFSHTHGDNGFCSSFCSSNCADSIQTSNVFRTSLFSAVNMLAPSCAANRINITWEDTDIADVTENNAGSVIYGGDVRTPVKAQKKFGMRFTGWTFSKPTTE